MTSATLSTVFSSATTALNNYVTLLFPLLLPVAIGLAILFGILWFIHGAANRKY